MGTATLPLLVLVLVPHLLLLQLLLCCWLCLHLLELQLLTWAPGLVGASATVLAWLLTRRLLLLLLLASMLI
jgi:hypothetical protein